MHNAVGESGGWKGGGGDTSLNRIINTGQGSDSMSDGVGKYFPGPGFISSEPSLIRPVRLPDPVNEYSYGAVNVSYWYEGKQLFLQLQCLCVWLLHNINRSPYNHK